MKHGRIFVMCHLLNEVPQSLISSKTSNSKRSTMAVMCVMLRAAKFIRDTLRHSSQIPLADLVQETIFPAALICFTSATAWAEVSTLTPASGLSQASTHINTLETCRCVECVVGLQHYICKATCRSSQSSARNNDIIYYDEMKS